MSHIHVEQDLTLKVDTNQALAGASVTQVIATDPVGNEYTWNGNIVETTKIQVAIPYTTLTAARYGRWLIKSYVVFSDGSRATGDTVPLYVREKWYNYK